LAAENSWDDDEDEEEQQEQQQGAGGCLQAAVPLPPRPMPPAAPKGPAQSAQVRQQQVLRLQEQAQVQRGGALPLGQAPAHQAPAAGVTEDPNWVEENWDSDEDE